MKDAIDWTENDVLSLIRGQIQESLTLDYKRSEALGKSDGKKLELSKDVSALANSSGGVLLFGIEEDGHYPKRIDGGVDREDFTKEWVEQVVNSSVYPKVDGLRINQIALEANPKARVLYAICVPAATSRAPHQAKDKRYYKRFNFESVPMEDYEVRDLFRRASTPDLWIDFQFTTGKTATVTFRPGAATSNPINLRATIGNRSREPALYAVIQILLDEKFATAPPVPLDFIVRGTESTKEGRSVRALVKNWAIPRDLPIFSEIEFRLSEIPFSFTLDELALQWPDFFIGYDIRAPGCSARKLIRVVQQPRGTLRIIDDRDAG